MKPDEINRIAEAIEHARRAGAAWRRSTEAFHDLLHPPEAHEGQLHDAEAEARLAWLSANKAEHEVWGVAWNAEMGVTRINTMVELIAVARQAHLAWSMNENVNTYSEMQRTFDAVRREVTLQSPGNNGVL